MAAAAGGVPAEGKEEGGGVLTLASPGGEGAVSGTTDNPETLDDTESKQSKHPCPGWSVGMDTDQELFLATGYPTKLIYLAMTMLVEKTTDAGADDGDGSLGKATFVQTFFVTGSGDSIKEVPTYVKGGGAAPNADVKLVSEMDAGDCEGILVELDKEVSIKKAHRKKLSKVLAVLMRAALDTAEVKKVRERVGFTTSNRASRARVLERPGPSGLRARASNGPPLCRAARARSLLTRMIEDRFVRI